MICYESFFYFYFFIELLLTCRILLVSGVKHSNSIFFLYYEMITMVSLVTTCHHTELLQYYWLYSLCFTYTFTYITFCDLFYSWKVMLLNVPYLFHSSSTSLPTDDHWFVLISVSVSLFCFACSFVLLFRFHI